MEGVLYWSRKIKRKLLVPPRALHHLPAGGASLYVCHKFVLLAPFTDWGSRNSREHAAHHHHQASWVLRVLVDTNDAFSWRCMSIRRTQTAQTSHSSSMIDRSLKLKGHDGGHHTAPLVSRLGREWRHHLGRVGEDVQQPQTNPVIRRSLC